MPNLDPSKLLEEHEHQATLLTWMAVHGNLCLSLRHPSNTGGSRALVEEFVKQLASTLVWSGIFTAGEMTAAMAHENLDWWPERQPGEIRCRT